MNGPQARDTRVGSSFAVAFPLLFLLGDDLRSFIEPVDGLIYKVFVGYERNRLRLLVSSHYRERTGNALKWVALYSSMFSQGRRIRQG
jgi:hypothetical protein